MPCRATIAVEQFSNVDPMRCQDSCVHFSGANEMAVINFPPNARTAHRFLLAFVVGATVLLASGLADASLIDPHGPIASEQKAHLIRVTVLTMIAILPVFVLVPIMLWRYRYKNTSARYDANWDSSRILEVTMWGVPIVITVLLSIQLWQSTKALDPYKPIDAALPPLNVQVVGLDWKWLFIYPEQGIASIGEMAFAAPRPLAFTLTSDTVMQSFMISALAGQIYVMPGMKTKLNLIADTVGVFKGENTQFNGDGFAAQNFRALAMSEDDFNRWVANAKAEGVALNSQTYSALGLRSTAFDVHRLFGTDSMPTGVVYFNDIPTQFFETIIARYHDGKALDPTKQPGGAHYEAVKAEIGSAVNTEPEPDGDARP